MYSSFFILTQFQEEGTFLESLKNVSNAVPRLGLDIMNSYGSAYLMSFLPKLWQFSTAALIRYGNSCFILRPIFIDADI